MALLRYLQSRDSLPDPRGALSSAMPVPWGTRSQEKKWTWTLQAVQRQTSCWNRQVCQSPRCGCSSSIFFQEAGLSCQRNYGTIDLELLRPGSSKAEGRRRWGHCRSSLEKTPPLLIGQELDTKVQLYLKKIRDGGGAVSARTVMGHFAEVWSNRACRVWESCGTQ